MSHADQPEPYDWAADYVSEPAPDEPVGLLSAAVDVEWRDAGWHLEIAAGAITAQVSGVGDDGLRALLGAASAHALIARRDQATDDVSPTTEE